ncbi:low temperature requirement protein LtrA [Brevundimonas alba]|uniref:Low temperature requirement protein LtrA n=1 Tax=Brevundimonas alba TaxID=74314 RepID=A0A7X5YL19_9CAUL|nr:low temperature requirement protein A [Brevundimonas alba]NJC41895.1 low temperature requirement protein LtrA [Brevundimonas alba]
MAGSLLREKGGQPAKVGFIELFFDLVFVFAVTQISHTLLEHLTWMGALQGAIMLCALWWAWIDTSWITNWLDPEHPHVRLLLFALMAAGLVMSTSLPEAFGEKGLVFACAFAALQVGRGLFTLRAVRHDKSMHANFRRITVWAAAGGLLWIVGGVLQDGARLAVWLVAVALEFAGPACYFWVPGLGRSHTSEWEVQGEHLAERVGLFVIICLGESVLVMGATFAGLNWTAPVVGAFAAAFIGTLAMWWIYFARAHQAASDAIEQSDDSGRVARRAYTYAPILVVAGVIGTAVGDELSLSHPGGPIEFPAAMALIGGPMLFLIGALTFKLASFGVWSPSRLAGVAALAALIFAVPWLTPAGLAASATAVLVGVAAWESLARRPTPHKAAPKKKRPS